MAIPRSRFGGVGVAAQRRIMEANLRPFAEALSRPNYDGSAEEIHAALTAMVFEQFQIMVSSIYHQGSIAQVPFMAMQTPRLIRPSEARNYVFVQNQSGGTQILLSINQDPIDPSASPANGVIIGANLGYYEPVVVPQDDLWVSATADNTPGILLISLPDWQKTLVRQDGV